MGSAQDLLNPSCRRLLVNACYWAMRMEQRIAERRSVELYEPLPFKFGGTWNCGRTASVSDRDGSVVVTIGHLHARRVRPGR